MKDTLQRQYLKALVAGDTAKAERLKNEIIQEGLPAPLVCCIGRLPDGTFEIGGKLLSIQEKNNYLQAMAEKNPSRTLVKIYLKKDDKDGTDGINE